MSIQLGGEYRIKNAPDKLGPALRWLIGNRVTVVDGPTEYGLYLIESDNNTVVVSGEILEEPTKVQ